MGKDDCIFCKIANGEITSATVYEDSIFRVILDVNPANKGHAFSILLHYVRFYKLYVVWVPPSPYISSNLSGLSCI